MGMGKTSWSIQTMNENQHKNYIFITPYLDEVTRIKASTIQKFYEPLNYGRTKTQDFVRHLELGHNIVATHALFRRVSSEVKDLIKAGNYTLILDEALDAIETYTDLKKGDLKFLKDEGCISIDERTGYIHWNNEKQYSDYKYEEFSICAQNNCLIYVNGKVLIWEFPPFIFDLFEEVYVLTYLFAGQILKYYFDYHDLQYQYKQVNKTDGKYELGQYLPQREPRDQFRDKINICYDDKLNSLGAKSNYLSLNWYQKNRKLKGKGDIALLKKNLFNYFKNKVDGGSSTKMWTTFSKYENDLQGQGYVMASTLKRGVTYTKEEEKKAKCFVPMNCRATNIFQDRYNLAYLINRFPQPFYEKFFEGKGIIFDKDAYALSELIQWIWRSRIRKGEPINLYIPSRRMRNLLVSWFNKEDIKSEFMKSAS